MDDRGVLLDAEWRYCAESFRYFFQNYWKCIVPGRGTINVDARPAQLETADLFQNERRIVVLKARQIGWTTAVTAYVFWKGYFHDNQEIAVLSRREDPEAKLIIVNIKFGYDQLPLWMRKRGPKITNDHMTKVIWSNGSTVESDASKDNPVRGRTLALLVLDELGKFPNPEQAWQSALPAVEYGQLIAIGNANHYMSRWWSIYTEAKSGVNNFIARFYPWNIEGIEHRTPEWFERETASMTPAERAAEYPENDEECWLVSGSPVFDTDILQALPLQSGREGIFDGETFVPTANGWLHLFEPPMPGRKYVIGADSARGLEHGDYSAAVVLAHDGRHVASIRSKLKPSALAVALNGVGRWYNKALLGVEINKDGAAVLDPLVEDMFYPNLFRRRSYNEVYQRVTTRYGWDTNSQSKPLMIAQLNDAFVKGAIRTTDPLVISEAIAYRYLGDGTMGGSPHDDMVIASAIAVQMLKELYVPGVGPEVEVPMLPPSRFEGFDGTFHGHARMGETPESLGESKNVIVMNRNATRRRVRL